MMHTVYTGKRIRLRPHHSKDEGLSMIREIHLGLVPGWGEQWTPLAETSAGWDECGWLDHEYAVFAIERLDSGETVGYETVRPPVPTRLGGFVATYIRRAHQRQGFGIEAKQLALSYLFDHYPCESVEAVTLSNHSSALRGLKATGMREEGRLRGCTISEGRWVDKVFFVLSRSEWERMGYRTNVVRNV